MSAFGLCWWCYHIGRKRTYYREKPKTLLFASKEIGLEVRADKIKNIFVSHDQNAGHSHKTDNSSFESVKQLRYLGTTATDQNSIQEEIMRNFKSGIACYHSVQKLLYSSFLYKNIKIKIFRTIIWPVVLYGCETWSLTLRGKLLEIVHQCEGYSSTTCGWIVFIAIWIDGKFNSFDGTPRGWCRRAAKRNGILVKQCN
jgi:hypothetical protein